MPTAIAAGSQALIALPAQGTLLLSGSGSYQVVPPTRPDISTGERSIASGSAAVGPFNVAVTVRCLASSGLSYDLLGSNDVVERDGDLALSPAESSAVKALVSGAGIVMGPSVMDATVSNALWVSNSVLVGEVDIPSNSVGPNGVILVSADWRNYSANGAIANFVLSGQVVNETGIGAGTSGQVSFEITANNSSRSQTTVRRADGSTYRSTVSLDAGCKLQVYVTKGAAADVVWLEKFTAQIKGNFHFGPASVYQDATQLQVVSRADILSNPLPSRVTADPRKAIRTLSSTPYTFPAKFFNLCDKMFPANSATPPSVPSSTVRTLEVPGVSIFELNTAQLSAAVSGPAGAGPFTGIHTATLAKLDLVMSRCAAAGKDVFLCLFSSSVGATPAWATALGASASPLTIPAAGANRTALFNSWFYTVQFMCQRYLTLHPSLNWWIEPINEPNTPGTVSMTNADMVALANNVVTCVGAFGGARVKMACSSYTDISGVTFNNSGPGGRPELHSFIGAGGWGTFDVLTYHFYGGNVLRKNLNSSDPYTQVGMFSHYLKIIDPLFNATSQGRQIGLQQMLTDAGVAAPASVPGGPFQGGKELWMTECGDAFVTTRDRKWYIALALICSSLGVSRYFFYYWGGPWTGAIANQYGALPDMDIGASPYATQEYAAAAAFLAGKTINWVNASEDLSHVAASINGVVYEF